MPNINPITQAANASNAVTAAAASAVKSNSAKISDLYNSDASMQRQNADSAALVEATKQAGQLQYETALQKTAIDIGTDIGDSTGLYAALSKQYIQSKAAQNVALDKINEKNSVSFFDDPLQYIINQATVDEDIDAHNAAQAKANIASGQISEMNLLTDQRAISAKKLQSTVTTASAAAAVSEVKNKALILADDYSRQAILQNTAGMRELVGLSEVTLKNAQSVFSAQAQQEQIGIAQAHLALSRQEFDWKKQEKEKGEAVGQYVSDTIIRGYKAMYPDNPDKWVAPNSPKLLALISGKLPLDGEMKYAFDRGEINSRAANPDGSNRILAVSPTDLLQGLKYGVQTGRDSKVVTDLVVDTARSVVASPAYQALNPKDAEGREKLINDAVATRLKSQSDLVKDPTNPYYLSTITDITKQTPALQNFALYKQIVAPAAASGIDVSTPNSVFHLGLAAVREGRISLNTFAVDLSTTYKQGQRVNIQSKQLTALGLAPLNAYNVKIDTGGFTQDTVNMTDPAAIVKAALKYRMNSVQATALQYLPGSN